VKPASFNTVSTDFSFSTFTQVIEKSHRIS
jgi:hypothetical protein